MLLIFTICGVIIKTTKETQGENKDHRKHRINIFSKGGTYHEKTGGLFCGGSNGHHARRLHKRTNGRRSVNCRCSTDVLTYIAACAEEWERFCPSKLYPGRYITTASVYIINTIPHFFIILSILALLTKPSFLLPLPSLGA